MIPFPEPVSDPQNVSKKTTRWVTARDTWILVVRVVDNWKGHLFCEYCVGNDIYFFSIILNVLFLLKLWSFIQLSFGCFISLINPLFWIRLKFHFIFIYIIIICISQSAFWMHNLQTLRVTMSCMTAVHDFFLDLDYSGYHKNLIQQLFSMITDRIRLHEVLLLINHNFNKICDNIRLYF